VVRPQQRSPPPVYTNERSDPGQGSQKASPTPFRVTPRPFFDTLNSMQIDIVLTHDPIVRPQAWPVPHSLETGSLVEFYGIVRETEDAAKIPALTYEAYAAMAEKIMREKIALLQTQHPCQAIRIVHRLGVIPAGESAIYVGLQSRHRREGFLFLQHFMDEFKKDVPIWKMK
jgi:molybdopterin synthase catalytic subunit